ncbi:E3 ubiquitin-protein ligase RNF183 [Alosa sapidissima]|uniref:E3 ubiquitin-protein ligase RNF183 n=1 Tax=Alosa sapidissima TaxID=34773 RepID=UPI001C098FD2|nr:E3 ubiquitin-protein ligase RNF183 [Alosa sapidissima]XP_041963462.1 E3 ubiquitin-protein ligase RNF183 [Alosa sapidissima]
MSEDANHHRKEGGRGSKPKTKHSKPQQEQKAKSTQPQNRKPERRHHTDRGPQRSRSSDSVHLGRSRGRHREKERDDGQVRRERGRSEEAHRRDSSHGNQHRSPVSPNDDFLGDTECPVCFCAYDNVFKTPKLLPCGHTFCLECLARINVSSPELKQLSCPVCREVTQLPHGRDLPQLVNNQEVFQKLPPEMQRALSVRFKRNKGKLELKSKLTHQDPTTTTLKKQQTVSNSRSLGLVESGVTGPVTSLDVGRPPNPMHSHMRRVFRSNQCYYAAVGAIIAVTVALMLVGVLVFVIIPRVSHTGGVRPPPGSSTQPPPGQPAPDGPP